MKKFFLMIFLFSTWGGEAVAQKSRYDEFVREIKEVLSVDEVYAKKLIAVIYNYCTEIQGHFKYLAETTNTDLSTHRDFVINEFFVSSLSTVGVSSINSNTVQTKTIASYLSSLANLRKNYGYVKIEVVFDPDYLGMGAFVPIGNNQYELSVSMWQYFKGWNKDGVLIYSDATKKKFRLVFYCNSANVLQKIKTDGIFVAETLPLNSINKTIR